MPESVESQTISPAPFSTLSAFLVEHSYYEMGCDSWTSRRVRELMAKLGDTPDVLAARLRVRPREFAKRLSGDTWTKQDGLILTMLEREVDFIKGGRIPQGSILVGGAS